MRTSVRNNASAYGFSVMITSSYGVTATLNEPPRSWMVVLFAFGSVAGFAAVDLGATHGFRVESADGERTGVQLLAALLGILSVLSAVGAAALVAWGLDGWATWLLAPLVGSAVYMLVNGLEYALAEEEEDEEAEEDAGGAG